MTWTNNNIWTVTITTAPNDLIWWYSVSRENQTERIEDLEIPRRYDFDCKEKYFQIVDKWEDYYTLVTPIVCLIHNTFQ